MTNSNEFEFTDEVIGEPGDPCKDCGRPSVDGFWCQGCFDLAEELDRLMEQERVAAGIPPCNFFERMVQRFGK